jgi:DNA-directed RNA polymerase
MGWLQDCAKVVAKEGLPITWTTPVGFPVVQHYKDFKLRRVKSKMGDSIIKLSLKEELDTIDKSRMASAISPNFVHSMDAAHLSWSVAYASNNGVTHYAMIHDSFGTHAADAEMMGACLRRAFVDMYQENNVLAQFRASLASLVEDDSDIPPVPKMGTLDLECVLESDFFFG